MVIQTHLACALKTCGGGNDACERLWPTLDGSGGSRSRYEQELEPGPWNLNWVQWEDDMIACKYHTLSNYHNQSQHGHCLKLPWVMTTPLNIAHDVADEVIHTINTFQPLT